MALIGCGGWGKNHLRTWMELSYLALACDADSATRIAIREAYPTLDVCADPEEVFRRADIDGVVIATPATTHAELARRALDAGKDVLVEKPMTTSLTDAEQLAVQSALGGRVLMVGHLLEYHPAVLRLGALIAEGALGRLRYLSSNRLNFGTLRTEENVLWSFAPHDVSVIVRLVGSVPEEVVCQGGCYLRAGQPDIGVLGLRFPRNVQAHVFASWLHPFKEHQLVVVGDEKMAVLDDTQPWERKLLLYPHVVDWQDGRPVARRAEGVTVELERAEPLRSECEHFVARMGDRRRPLTDAWTGLRVLQVLEAGERSLLARGAPVAVGCGISRDRIEADLPE